MASLYIQRNYFASSFSPADHAKSDDCHPPPHLYRRKQPLQGPCALSVYPHLPAEKPLRGSDRDPRLSGFGRDTILHTSDLLDLSSDLPIVIEIVDSEEKIEALKAYFETEDILGSGLVTEEKIKIFRYGK
jgi:PII-like signaling protein